MWERVPPSKAAEVAYRMAELRTARGVRQGRPTPRVQGQGERDGIDDGAGRPGVTLRGAVRRAHPRVGARRFATGLGAGRGSPSTCWSSPRRRASVTPTRSTRATGDRRRWASTNDFSVTAGRGRDAVHRRRACVLRGHRLPQHGRRGDPQRRAADRVRALDAARRRHRRHPRRRQRRPRLGVERRHDGRRVVPQPPVRGPPVPDGDRQRRGPDASGHPGSAGPWVRRRVVQLHRRAPRKVHVLAHARREHLQEQDGRPRRRPPDRVVLELRRRPALLHGARAHGSYWEGRRGAYRRTSSARSSGPSGEAAGDCGAARQGMPTDASFDKVTLDDNTENPMEIAVRRGRPVYYVELAGKVKTYDPGRATSASSARSRCTAATRTGCWASRSTPTSHQPPPVPLLQRAAAGGTDGLQHISRFTLAATGASTWPPRSVLLRIPHQRLICCHSSGSIAFGPDGDLYISTGDDTSTSRPTATPRSTTTSCARTSRAIPGTTPTTPTTRAARRATRTTCAARSCASTPRTTRPARPAPATPTHPGRQPVPAVRQRPGEDPARDLHDGPPQPVPDLGRPGDRLALQRRGRPGRQQRQRDPRPARLRRAQPDPRGRATWAGRSASRTTRPDEGPPRTATGRSRAARPARRSTARAAGRPTLHLEHRADPDAAGQAGAALVAVRPLAGLPDDPGRPRPHGDRRPDLPLRRRPTRPRRSSRRTTTTRCSSRTGRATGSRR